MANYQCEIVIIGNRMPDSPLTILAILTAAVLSGFADSTTAIYVSNTEPFNLVVTARTKSPQASRDIPFSDVYNPLLRHRCFMNLPTSFDPIVPDLSGPQKLYCCAKQDHQEQLQSR